MDREIQTLRNRAFERQEQAWLTPPESSDRLESLFEKREELLAQLAWVEETLWEEYGLLAED